MRGDVVQGLTVGRASPTDARAIAEISICAWRRVYKGVFSEGFLDSLSADQRQEEWLQRIKAPGRRHVWAARTGEAVRGYALVGPSRDSYAVDKPTSDRAELIALYVDPRYWGIGIGKALLLQVVADATGSGYSSLELWVWRGNHRARTFYEAAGWAESGETKIDHREGGDLEEVKYILPLKRE